MTRADYQAGLREVTKKQEMAAKLAQVRIRLLCASMARALLHKGAYDKTAMVQELEEVILSEAEKPANAAYELAVKAEVEIYGLPPRKAKRANAAPKIPGWVLPIFEKNYVKLTERYEAGRISKADYDKRIEAMKEGAERINAAQGRAPEGPVKYSTTFEGYNGKNIEVDMIFTKRYDLAASAWVAVDDMENKIMTTLQFGRSQGWDAKEIGRQLETYIKYNDGGQRVIGRWGKLLNGYKVDPKTGALVRDEKNIREGWKRQWLKEQRPDLQWGTEEATDALRGSTLWVEQQMGTRRLPEAVKAYSQRLGKAGLDYRAVRLTRTETAAMLADEQTAIARDSVISTGKVEWVLDKGRDAWKCHCAEYAAGGPYDIDNLPSAIPVHPGCECSLRPILKSTDEVLKSFGF